MKKIKNIKIALVCTSGGHFEQMTNLSDFYNRYNHFWITNRNKQTESQLEGERKYYIQMAHFKAPWSYLHQLAPVLKVYAREKPTHALSTGSGRTAFIPFLVARLSGIRFLYIDTFSRVRGYSKFGTFLLKSGHPIFTQWNDPGNGKAKYIGPIFKKIDEFSKNSDRNHIFITVGTRNELFPRLIQAIEELKRKGAINEKVIVQAGYTKYDSDCLEIFDFCTPERIDELILNAKLVVTQESAGIGTKCLKYNTKFIVMPREYRYGELPAKSDMNEDLHLKLEEMGYTKVVRSTEELRAAIESVNELKSGFEFDNKLAMATLEKIMEEV